MFYSSSGQSSYCTAHFCGQMSLWRAIFRGPRLLVGFLDNNASNSAGTVSPKRQGPQYGIRSLDTLLALREWPMHERQCQMGHRTLGHQYIKCRRSPLLHYLNTPRPEQGTSTLTHELVYMLTFYFIAVMNPQWKMQWDYNEIVQLVDFLVKNTAMAERESHLHELWSEVLTFICKAFKKDLARLSCIPQFELGNQRSKPKSNSMFSPRS